MVHKGTHHIGIHIGYHFAFLLCEMRATVGRTTWMLFIINRHWIIWPGQRHASSLHIGFVCNQSGDVSSMFPVSLVKEHRMSITSPWTNFG
jgi:hypothetical protein